MNITDKHRKNSLDVRRGVKPVVKPHQTRIVEVRLEQSPDGRWITFIGDSGSGFPSTDVEVSLWLRLQQQVQP